MQLTANIAHTEDKDAFSEETKVEIEDEVKLYASSSKTGSASNSS
jgi:hypothetical protein